jgi:hypothetical protein
MSFIRTIRKNVAAYRARKSVEHYTRQAFGIEQLEPRLLLTADISAANAEIIMDDLSKYSISVLDNITVADVVTAEYNTNKNNYSSVENMLDNINDDSNGKVTFNLSSLSNHAINVGSIGTFSFYNSSNEAAANVPIGGTISFDYSNGNVGSFSSANLAISTPTFTNLDKTDFGFLKVTLGSNTSLNLTATFDSNGTLTYNGSGSVGISATIPGGTSHDYTVQFTTDNTDKLTISESTGVLNGFQNIDADSVAGQIKSFKDWLDSLGTSSLFTGSAFDTGIMDSDTISSIMNFSDAFSSQILYGSTNAIFKDSSLTEANFTDAQSLAALLGDGSIELFSKVVYD